MTSHCFPLAYQFHTLLISQGILNPSNLFSFQWNLTIIADSNRTWKKFLAWVKMTIFRRLAVERLQHMLYLISITLDQWTLWLRTWRIATCKLWLKTWTPQCTSLRDWEKWNVTPSMHKHSNLLLLLRSKHVLLIRNSLLGIFG